MAIPTYSVEQLNEMIAIADLNDITTISAILRKEFALYRSNEYNDLLIGVTRRLIVLSKAIKPH